MEDDKNTNSRLAEEELVNIEKTAQNKEETAKEKLSGQAVPDNLPFAPEEKSEKEDSEAGAVTDITAAEQDDEPTPPDINTASETMLEPVRPTADNEAELPPEPTDIKPDEIVRIEQPAPEEISAEDLSKAKELETYNLPPRIILPASKKNDASSPDEIPSPKTEAGLAELNQKKLAELAEVKNKSDQSPPEKQKKSFMSDYLKKLSEFRLKANAKRTAKKEKNLETIMEYAERKNRITNDDIQKLTRVSDIQAQRYLKTLIKKGRLIKFGKTKNTFYKPIK